jgi:hypothetical protein
MSFPRSRQICPRQREPRRSKERQLADARRRGELTAFGAPRRSSRRANVRGASTLQGTPASRRTCQRTLRRFLGNGEASHCCASTSVAHGLFLDAGYAGTPRTRSTGGAGHAFGRTRTDPRVPSPQEEHKPSPTHIMLNRPLQMSGQRRIGHRVSPAAVLRSVADRIRAGLTRTDTTAPRSRHQSRM